MQKTHQYARLGLIAGLLVACLPGGPAGLLAEEAATDVPPADAAWQEQAVEYARIMSRVPGPR